MIYNPLRVLAHSPAAAEALQVELDTWRTRSQRIGARYLLNDLWLSGSRQRYGTCSPRADEAGERRHPAGTGKPVLEGVQHVDAQQVGSPDDRREDIPSLDPRRAAGTGADIPPPCPEFGGGIRQRRRSAPPAASRKDRSSRPWCAAMHRSARASRQT